MYIEPSHPWKKSCGENFTGKLREEFPNGEVFELLRETPMSVERWRQEYNQQQSHSILVHRPAASESRFPLSGPGSGLLERTSDGPKFN